MKGVALNRPEKLAAFAARYSPRTVAETNDTAFRLAKLHGAMEIAFHDHTVTLREGVLCVIPRGVEHITRASGECHALIIVPRSVVNTGDTLSHLTADNDMWV